MSRITWSVPSASRLSSETGELLPSAGLDGADDLDQQAALGAEVVEEHSMAGPDRGGDLAQAHVPEPVDDEVVHHMVDELLLGCLALHVPNGTLTPGTRWIGDRRSEASWVDR